MEDRNTVSADTICSVGVHVTPRLPGFFHLICMTTHTAVLLTPVRCLMQSSSIYRRMEVAEGSESPLILALRLKGRDGERGRARREKEKERATAMIRRDEEMSAQQVKGFMGEGGGVGKKKNRGGIEILSGCTKRGNT